MSADVLAIALAVLVAVLVVAAAASVPAYLVAHRLDRLHIRTDHARDALVGALALRHAAAGAVARDLDRQGRPGDASAVRAALDAALGQPTGAVTGDDLKPIPALATRRTPHAALVSVTRSAGSELAENRLGLALAACPPGGLAPEVAAELDDATDRVRMARSFYNDAVRDTRALRDRRMVRWLHLAGHAPMPDFVELVDPG